MAKRTGSDTSTHQAKVKKKRRSFKMEWLSEYAQIKEQPVKLGEIFSFSSEKGLLCKTGNEAKVVMEVGLPQTTVRIVRRLKMGSGECKRPREKERAVTQNKFKPGAS